MLRSGVNRNLIERLRAGGGDVGLAGSSLQTDPAKPVRILAAIDPEASANIAGQAQQTGAFFAQSALIENSTIYGNTADDNTAGIVAFDLPGNPIVGRDVRLRDNIIKNNNHVNFAPGGTVAKIPSGTGTFGRPLDT